MARKKKALTPQQSEQRELAWLLFITEGYWSNVNHALTVNAYTLNELTLNEMQHALDSTRRTADRLRRRLQRITPSK